MNQYPKWKAGLISLLIVLGLIYAAPNLFSENPAIQLSAIKEDSDLSSSLDKIKSTLDKANIDYKAISTEKNKVLIRFPDTNSQAKAKQAFEEALGDEVYTAMTISPATPNWMQSWGLKPITKGLDLRGGVHLLLQVDTKYLVERTAETNLADVRSTLDETKISYKKLETSTNGGVVVELSNAGDMTRLENAIYKTLPDLERVVDSANAAKLNILVTDSMLDALKAKAVEQNMITLRSRMDSIGVAEPSVTREGTDRISVQLPGLSDPEDAKRVLSSTASLEYYLVDEEAQASGKRRFGVKFINDESGKPIALKRKVIMSGSHIIDASSGTDQNGQIAVNVVLDAAGASKMAEITYSNLQKPMAVVFIEFKPVQIKNDEGKLVTETLKEETVISVANIQSEFSKRFQTTGNFSPAEGRNLARSLRSGALVAPVYVIEERTVGPSAGKQNIKQGISAIVLGFTLVMIFMAVYYKKFGFIAITALLLNVVFIVAILSFIGATLSLPGIAGVVLTMGMAVDANVLIFERIKEEQRNGKSVIDAIKYGFDNAFSTITDANITTLIAAAILFAFGTGPIKGFAITLSIGIVTSMFTAIVVSRFIIHIWQGNKRDLKKLSI